MAEEDKSIAQILKDFFHPKQDVKTVRQRTSDRGQSITEVDRNGERYTIRGVTGIGPQSKKNRKYDKPVGPPNKKVAPATTEYKVKKGDTLSQIAKAAGMTLPQLKALNPSITDYNKVGVGQILNLEKGNATSPYTGVSKSEMARMAKDTAVNKAKTTSKKRGGKVGKPRGVGAAQRGFGKAMKGGK